MANVLLDTHSVIWYLTNTSKLSARAATEIESANLAGTIYVSAITIVEIVYLTDKNKLPVEILTMLLDSTGNASASVHVLDLSLDIARAVTQIPRTLVPDMPDRIIAATGLSLGLPIVTKDPDIGRCSNVVTIW